MKNCLTIRQNVNFYCYDKHKIKDINVKSKILKYVEDDIGEYLQDLKIRIGKVLFLKQIWYNRNEFFVFSKEIDIKNRTLMTQSLCQPSQNFQFVTKYLTRKNTDNRFLTAVQDLKSYPWYVQQLTFLFTPSPKYRFVKVTRDDTLGLSGQQ